MTYVALLRGINVGGNRKIEMKRLKATFEQLGLGDVRTYINSGNVIFRTESTDATALAGVLEAAIETDFGFPVKVLVRSADDIRALVDALPADWANDDAAKCDVMFLAEEIDGPDILDRLTIKPDIDDARYVPGAVLWRVERPKATRSGMMKLVGTELYAQMTVRNCNTARKLDSLMRQGAEAEPH
jgi:uncharacterized protein (DUF1697 family)